MSHQDVPPCPLLTIPYELRLRIYKLLFTSDRNRAIEIKATEESWNARSSTRLVGNICTAPADCPCEDDLATDQKSMDEQKHGCKLERTKHSEPKVAEDLPHQASTLPYWRAPLVGSTIHLAILTTCRQVYYEAHALPYKLNIFRFIAVENLALFARAISPVSAKGIHAISLIITTDNPGKHFSPLDIALIRHRIANLHTLMVFVSLKGIWGSPSRIGVEDILLKLFRGLGHKLAASVVHVGDKRPELSADGRDSYLDDLFDNIVEGRRRWGKRVEEALMQ